MRTGNLVLGLAGLAIGAISAILFAPDKGSSTRKQILGKSNDLMNKIKSKSNDFVDSTLEKFESTTKKAENLAEKGKSEWDHAKKKVKNATAS